MAKQKLQTPTILGIPFDAQSSYLRGAADAPPLIRQALRCDASNLWSETGVDVGGKGALADAGDLKLGEKGAFSEIEAGVAELLRNGAQPLCLGGDHSVTYPVVRAFAKKFRDLTIVHFDAHPDLYDNFEGNRLSHACPFARIMEEKLAKRLVQIGIRTWNEHQKEQAKKFKVKIVPMIELPALSKVKKLRGPVYVSFDVDALDPAFAPGVSHREPGGLSVRAAIAHLHAIGGQVVGADLVEFNPRQDVAGMTATVCGKLVKEMVGVMWRKGGD
jgi:agmatinase